MFQIKTNLYKKLNKLNTDRDKSIYRNKVK